MIGRSLIKVIFSIILAFALVITAVTTFPKVASAQYTSNTALEALEAGIEFYEQGDLDNAESSYQEAIDLVLASKYVDIFISTKQHLAKIKENQGNIEEANRLNEEAEAAITALGEDIPPPSSSVKCCICPEDCGVGREERGIDPSFCKRCN